MKKIVCLLLAVLSVVMFAACIGKPEQTEKQAESHTEAPAVDSGEKAAAPTGFGNGLLRG